MGSTLGGIPGTPLPTAGLRIWLRADSNVVSSAGKVSSWTSRVNGFAFNQATAAKQPTLLDPSSDLNDRPAIDFDGVDDLLVHAAAPLSSSAGTIFAVGRLSALDNFDMLLTSCDEAGTVNYLSLWAYGIAIHPSLGYSERNGAPAADDLKGSTAVLADTNYIWEYSTGGSTIAMKLNGATQTVTAIGGGNNGDWYAAVSGRDNTVIGARKTTTEAFHLAGQLAELLVYNVELAAGDATTVRDYLGDRYAISV